MTIEPITKEVIAKIKDVMSQIKDGKLKHEQSQWHCGTAHCLIGWLLVLRRTEETGNEKQESTNKKQNTKH